MLFNERISRRSPPLCIVSRFQRRHECSVHQGLCGFAAQVRRAGRQAGSQQLTRRRSARPSVALNESAPPKSIHERRACRFSRVRPRRRAHPRLPRAPRGSGRGPCAPRRTLGRTSEARPAQIGPRKKRCAAPLCVAGVSSERASERPTGLTHSAPRGSSNPRAPRSSTSGSRRRPPPLFVGLRRLSNEWTFGPDQQSLSDVFVRIRVYVYVRACTALAVAPHPALARPGAPRCPEGRIWNWSRAHWAELRRRVYFQANCDILPLFDLARWISTRKINFSGELAETENN